MATICHTNEKLEAAHHKFQRRLLGLHGRIKSEINTLENWFTGTGSERRLRWFGHVLRMDNTRTRQHSGN